MRFIDTDGLMHLEPIPSDRVENSVLYTITYYLLKGDFPKNFDVWLYQFYDNGIFYDYPDNHTHPTSHDNMTSIITAMAIFNVLPKKILLRHYPHPRDWIYIGYLQRKFWAYPFLPLLFVIFLWSALTKYKTRNGVKIFKTDTEILFWLRTNLPKRFWFIHKIKLLIVFFMKRKFGSDWVANMMNIYYKHPGHPNRVM